MSFNPTPLQESPGVQEFPDLTQQIVRFYVAFETLCGLAGSLAKDQLVWCLMATRRAIIDSEERSELLCPHSMQRRVFYRYLMVTTSDEFL
jgi:hypothetical protein